MAEYNPKEIEKKWQEQWEKEGIYKVENDPSKPKYYVLDMFPYPSGAGLHVGHPLGYIASDIVSRYKRSRGFNVLHPMGFDSFGLPAEQYAIQTGQHPAVTTEQNIKRYIEQLRNIGFSYDWSREVRTSDPSYYKWTQWIFMQLFNAWYNLDTDKAEPIATLISTFEHSGNRNVRAACDEDAFAFTNEDWRLFSEKEKADVLLKYRLTYLAESVVNWCPALGTVLANDEVKDGVSERGGYPVERKKMKQWSMRITAYADRLLRGLDAIDWPEPLKEMQRNWIGKSLGAELTFPVKGQDLGLTVFTTRIDTIFGVTYLSIAPEHELIPQLTSPGQKAAVEEYVRTAANRSERDRMSDVKTVSGVFTGTYVTNPLTGEDVPLWIADYVLAGYGTGVVMGVPSSDDRDFRFAKHFNLPIVCVIEGTETLENPTEVKYGRMINSGFLNGLDWLEAVRKAIEKAEGLGVGRAKINFRMRDAVFSRQRYWGEPVPVYFKDDLPHLLDESELPLVLPEIDQYKPTETGEPPLGRAKDWKYQGKYEYELSTMPGWAGSSWYFFRYMDPHNDQEFCSKEAQAYWQDVDLYIGGSEHATGHLLYSRFWTKVLFDLGHVTVDEPFKKLVNQGMIQGVSNFVYRLDVKFNRLIDGLDETIPQAFVSNSIRERLENGTFTNEEKDRIREYIKKYLINNGLGSSIDVIEINFDTTPLYVDVNIVEFGKLNEEKFREWRSDYKNAILIEEETLSGYEYICGTQVEKMSKSKFNVVNPDDVVDRYGADTMRMYEMFLGPLTDAKPWNTNGITGVHNFLRKYWRLFHTEKGDFQVSDAEPTKDELKALHKLIKKVADDVENLSLNTSVSAFMVCVNELSSLKCNKRAVLGELTVVLSSFAPHVAEETWHLLGNTGSVTRAPYPDYNASYLVEDTFEYPVSINGKVRAKMTFAADTAPAEIESSVLASEAVQRWLEGKQPKKIIVVPKRIVNVVL